MRVSSINLMKISNESKSGHKRTFCKIFFFSYGIGFATNPVIICHSSINNSKLTMFINMNCRYTHWGTSARCYNTTEPIFDETYWPNAVNRSMMEIAESTIEKLKRRAPGLYVEYLNITQLSGYREDARPSIYKAFWKSQDKEQFKDHTRFSDCIHWCLPGVPDTWNQFLYVYIMKS